MDDQHQLRAISFSSLALLLCIAGYIYIIALPGYFLFDAANNLQELGSVHDWRSFLVFSSSGTSGPLGRPIALATFALQAYAWPNGAAPFLALNIVIHLLAMIAVFLLSLGLARLRLQSSIGSLWVGLAVTALWGLSPFLALTNLQIIQRMASLAGLFVFVGLAAFVWAHHLPATHKIRRWILLSAGLGLCTTLAVFSKENGALLPLFATLIVWLWVPPQNHLNDRISKALIVSLAVLPLLLLIAYLGQRLLGTIENGYGSGRYFTPIDRMMAQPTILLDYVRNLVFPNISSVTPFMDELRAPTGWLNPPFTLAAAVIWPILLIIAITIRKKAPYFLFGLAFFLSGHLLESSFLGLELYFAHRNYVPSFGIYFAIAFAISQLPRTYFRVASISMVAYVFLFGAVLVGVTSTWNDTEANAEFWLTANPYSQRAAQFFATQLNNQGKYFASRQVLDDSAERNPKIPLIHIQRTSNCFDREDEYTDLMADVLQSLKTTDRYQSQAAAELVKLAKKEDPRILCPLRDHQSLDAMANALLENSLYQQNDTARSLLYLTKALVALHTDKAAEAAEYFNKSLLSQPNLDVATQGVLYMTGAGFYEQAYNLLDITRESMPESHINTSLWDAKINRLLLIVQRSEEIDRIQAK